jgi:hypothetical protein
LYLFLIAIIKKSRDIAPHAKERYVIKVYIIIIILKNKNSFAKEIMLITTEDIFPFSHIVIRHCNKPKYYY